jgi:hypothetical protein
MTSGAAALILQKYPTMTPDALKNFIKKNAYRPCSYYCGWSSTAAGSGELSLGKLATASPSMSYTQNNQDGTGTGSLEAARGTDHLSDDGVSLTGEQDIFGGDLGKEGIGDSLPPAGIGDNIRLGEEHLHFPARKRIICDALHRAHGMESVVNLKQSCRRVQGPGRSPDDPQHFDAHGRTDLFHIHSDTVPPRGGGEESQRPLGGDARGRRTGPGTGSTRHTGDPGVSRPAGPLRA